MTDEDTLSLIMLNTIYTFNHKSKTDIMRERLTVETD